MKANACVSTKACVWVSVYSGEWYAFDSVYVSVHVCARMRGFMCVFSMCACAHTYTRTHAERCRDRDTHGERHREQWRSVALSSSQGLVSGGPSNWVTCPCGFLRSVHGDEPKMSKWLKGKSREERQSAVMPSKPWVPMGFRGECTCFSLYNTQIFRQTSDSNNSVQIWWKTYICAD